VLVHKLLDLNRLDEGQSLLDELEAVVLPLMQAPGAANAITAVAEVLLKVEKISP